MFSWFKKKSSEPNEPNENETAVAMREMAAHSPGLAEKRGYKLDFTETSILFLELYLSEIHYFLLSPESTWTDKMKWSTAMIHGVYIGEVLRRTRGGSWQAGTIDNPKMVIGLVEITPADKVMKRLTNGFEDQIANYFRSILTCIEASKGAEEGSRVIVG